MRAGLYARYSTDNQRPTSIEDQLRLGRNRARALGADDVVEYTDPEISAALPVESRPGSRRLMADAAAGRLQVLVIEALDRFSRNLVDQERMVRRLEFIGVRLIGFADGYDSALKGREIMRAVRGSFNEEQLRVIAAKTHRGLSGQVARGYHAGGISYGYRSSVAGVDAKGEPIGHRLAIDPERADVVRWIFARYAAGWSCQRIAADLNRRRVPSPRGSTWAVSAIYGSPRKGSGILNNELYTGRYVWNRSQWLRDPDTGRRKRFDRPREEWAVEPRPDLRIVDDAAWAQVRARFDAPRLAGGARGRGARPRTLFGGLMRCGRCEGAVIAVSQRAYGCAARKDRGADVCIGLFVPRRDLEARLLSLLREDLLSADAIAELQRQVAAMTERHRREAGHAGIAARARSIELEREIAHLVDAVASFGPSEALKTRLAAAEAERVALTSTPAPIAPARTLQDALVRYKRLLTNLKGALERDVPRARELLKELLGKVRLAPADNGEVWAEVETRPAILLQAAGGASLDVVAGTRFVIRKRIRVR